MADGEPPAAVLDFQDFGSSGEGAIGGSIGKGPAPAAASFTVSAPRACALSCDRAAPPLTSRERDQQAPAAVPASDGFGDTAKLLGGLGGGAQTGTSWNPFSIATYQQYFDVDTADIVDRLRRSVSLENKMFFEGEMRPDMYGPFWLCTTLVFVMAAAGNLGSLLSFVPTEDKQVFTYNFSKLTVATSVLYGYCLVVPIAGWGASKVMLAEPFSLLELICIYGYSLAVYIPAAMLCVLPMEFLRWVVIAGGFAVSLKFITRNVRDLVIRQVRSGATCSCSPVACATLCPRLLCP